MRSLELRTTHVHRAMGPTHRAIYVRIPSPVLAALAAPAAPPQPLGREVSLEPYGTTSVRPSVL